MLILSFLGAPPLAFIPLAVFLVRLLYVFMGPCFSPCSSTCYGIWGGELDRILRLSFGLEIVDSA